MASLLGQIHSMTAGFLAGKPHLLLKAEHLQHSRDSTATAQLHEAAPQILFVGALTLHTSDGLRGPLEPWYQTAKDSTTQWICQHYCLQNQYHENAAANFYCQLKIEPGPPCTTAVETSMCLGGWAWENTSLDGHIGTRTPLTPLCSLHSCEHPGLPNCHQELLPLRSAHDILGLF